MCERQIRNTLGLFPGLARIPGTSLRVALLYAYCQLNNMGELPANAVHIVFLSCTVVTKHIESVIDMRGMLEWIKRASEVHLNNSIYKGYRLTAKVSRNVLTEVEAEPSGPAFTASVFVIQADTVRETGDEYPVPRFAEGGHVYSPREAVHAAISHGREIVDGLMGVLSA